MTSFSLGFPGYYFPNQSWNSAAASASASSSGLSASAAASSGFGSNCFDLLNDFFNSSSGAFSAAWSGNGTSGAFAGAWSNSGQVDPACPPPPPPPPQEDEGTFIFGSKKNQWGNKQLFKEIINGGSAEDFNKKMNRKFGKKKAESLKVSNEDFQNLKDLYNRMDPQAKSLFEDYGNTKGNKYGGQTIIFDNDGHLVGQYKTKDVQKLNGNFKTNQVNQFKDGQFNLPGGQSVDVDFDKFQSPLAFDLNGDGVKTSSSKTQFDIDGDGKKDTINDVNDGILSIRGGANGKDLLGNNTDLDGDGKADGYANGFDALKALATKEGLINGKDDMKLDANDLAILEKKYQLGMKTGGYNSQAQSLASLGIDEIDLGKSNNTSTVNNFDNQGNILSNQQGASFRINGQQQNYADIWHKLY